MTGDQWERLKVLFHGALDQPPEQRQEWLARQFPGDEMLAREAAALVDAHETAGGFLDEPAVFNPADLAGQEEPRSGTRIGSYEVEREIDRGGQGIVYVARDLRLGRRVALKALSTLRDSDATLQERLRREARAAATISHPAVATVYALEEIDGRLFIASEYIDGHSLRSEIDQAPLEPVRALGIAADIVRALCAAHEAGVIHRDLKPENVLITDAGAVKVVDFGIAQVADALTRLTRTGDLVGTPAYMPPEQILGGATDARADIYAVGIILTEMLTGQHPLAPGRRPMPTAVSEIAWRCIQADPDARYPTARELLAALERQLMAPAQLTESPTPVQEEASPSLWWWEFHQAAASAVYAVMIWPTWLAHGVIGGREGNAVFVAVLAAAIVGATLRLHLWFTSRHYPAELRWARARAAGWMVAADVVFATALVVAGLVGEARPLLAIIEISVGIAAASAFAVVEPATTRAAFRQIERL